MTQSQAKVLAEIISAKALAYNGGSAHAYLELQPHERHSLLRRSTKWLDS